MTAIPPVAELTWQFNVCQTLTGTYRDFLFKIKQSLVSTGLMTPWTVVASCNQTTVSTSDLWTTASELRFGGTNGNASFSWIVLQNTGGSQMLISCIEYNRYFEDAFIIRYAPAGGYASFTSTSVNPGNANDLLVADARGTGINVPKILHVIHSTDGKHTRITGTTGISPAQTRFLAILDSGLTVQPGVTWSMPNQGIWFFTNAENATLANLVTNANCKIVIEGALTSANMSLEMYGANVTAVSRTTVMSTTNAWALAPVTGLWSGGKIAMPSSVAASTLPDVLFASSTNVTGSAYLNSSGEAVWVQFGCIVLPWNNSSVLFN
ncbi:MAG: hypothetical protein ACOYO1_05075 [Bacteroidales bacterium]